MDNNEPLVTVLIPVYNRPSVVNTIKSVIGQTYKNLEILIVDNASTDETVDAIQRIDDSRIRVLINVENRGQTYSLNRGLKEATGKYIARIDSDDIALPRRIEKQVHFMEKNPDFVLVGSWVRFISDDDKLGMVVKMPTTDEGMRLMQTVACGMYHPSAMYRSDVIQKYHYEYNPQIKMAADYDLWVRLMEHGKACNLGEELIYYRRGNNNDSRHHEDLMGRESSEIRRRACEIRCSVTQKKQIVEMIDLERKDKKSIVDCLKIYEFYKRYLKKNMSSSSPDFPILKRHFQIKVYGSCFANNSNAFAGIMRKTYVVMRNTCNRIGGGR